MTVAGRAVNEITPENKKLFIEVTRPVYKQFEPSIGKDFLDLAISGHHWPAFNVADSAICIGVAVLFLDMLRHEEEPKPGPDAAPGG